MWRGGKRKAIDGGGHGKARGKRRWTREREAILLLGESIFVILACVSKPLDNCNDPLLLTGIIGD